MTPIESLQGIAATLRGIGLRLCPVCGDEPGVCQTDPLDTIDPTRHDKNYIVIGSARYNVRIRADAFFADPDKWAVVLAEAWNGATQGTERIGQIVIPAVIVSAAPEKVAAMFGRIGFLPRHVEINARGDYAYSGVCPEFREIRECDAVPAYCIRSDWDDAGNLLNACIWRDE